mgnify:CR=1 FL=1
MSRRGRAPDRDRGAAFAPHVSPVPPTVPFVLPSLDALPPADAAGMRLPLEHDGTRVGMLALEGVAPGPGRAAAAIIDAPEGTLRVLGLVAAVAGVLLVWFARR